MVTTWPTSYQDIELHQVVHEGTIGSVRPLLVVLHRGDDTVNVLFINKHTTGERFHMCLQCARGDELLDLLEFIDDESHTVSVQESPQQACDWCSNVVEELV